MNNPAMTIKGEQAKKQLIAAALAQFLGEYGMNATTREIAAQAGRISLPSPTTSVRKKICTSPAPSGLPILLASSSCPHAQEAERLFAQPQPDHAIRELILRACRNMIKLLTQDDTVNLSKFISREQLSPTAAYHLVHEQVISPLTQPPDTPDCRLDRLRRQ